VIVFLPMESIKNAVKRVGYELNPVNDMESFESHMNAPVDHPLVVLPWVVVYATKHAIRGAVAGAVLGTAVALASGSDVAESANIGAVAGAVVDVAQFGIRYLVLSVEDMAKHLK